MIDEQSQPSATSSHRGERPKQQSKKHLIFRLGKELLCSPLSDVKEIIGVPDATPLPEAPAYVRGFINLRGRIISLVDLGKRLGNRSAQVAQPHRPCTIIVECHGVIAGFIVDDVVEVARVNEQQIDRETQGASSNRNHAITGVVRLNERSLALLISLPQLASEATKAHQ